MQSRAYYSVYYPVMFAFGCVALAVLLPGFMFGGCFMGRRFSAERAACERGDVAKCIEVGKLYESSSYDTSLSYTLFGPDAHAALFYKRACVLGSLDGCHKFGWNVATYELTSASLDAIGTLGRRCDAKDATSCYYAGYLYARGQGTAKDPARAAALCAQACDGGLSNACYVLAALYDVGRGVPRDATKSRDLVARACDGNYDDACDCLREMKASGQCGWSANASRWLR